METDTGKKTYTRVVEHWGNFIADLKLTESRKVHGKMLWVVHVKHRGKMISVMDYKKYEEAKRHLDDKVNIFKNLF